MGKLRQINVNMVMQQHYPRDSFFSKPNYRLNPNLNKDDTYIAIYTLFQEPVLKELKKQKNVKILYESERAYNWNMGGREPRNKVVVFELVDDEKSS